MGDKTLTRVDLCDAVYQKVGLSRTESAELVETVASKVDLPRAVAHRAVRETTGLVLTWSGSILRAYYSSTVGGRAAVIYSRHALGGAWARDDLGNPEYPVTPGGAPQREEAIRLGVNLVMYALCLDYKADQVHVPFIMKRRRWRPSE